ncbi:MAG: SDR family oxidoreductase [Propionivibrio sp.]
MSTSTYFVTGATGAIGSALIPMLLERADTRIVLLLRAKSDDDLASRLEKLFDFWQLGPADAGKRNRVRALRGDVALPHFGVADADYDVLCAECTHIVHSAGNVRMNLPIDQARHSSVDSARSIIELGKNCRRLEKIEFVSTVGVGGRTRGAVPEDWLSTSRDFHNTYEQAKAEAEEHIRPAVEGGLPLTVHRPSMVVGNAANGRIIHFQIFYHLCEFLAGSRTFGLTPDFGRARLDIVPADYVARIIAWSSQTNASSGGILHSCSGPEFALLLAPLQESVRQAFAAGRTSLPVLVHLPTGLFKAILTVASVFMSSDIRRAVKTLPVFLDYLATEQTFANHRTQTLLEPAGLPLPLPVSYLDKVLSYYLEHRIVPRS